MSGDSPSSQPVVYATHRVFFLLLSYMKHEMFLLPHNRSLSVAEKHPGKLKFNGRAEGLKFILA